MSSYKKLKVGVFGVGVMGDHHARICSSLPGVKLEGVCDIDREKGESVAKKYKTNFFSDPKLLIEKIDAGIVATPTSTHFEIGKILIEENKHLLIEKPITKNLEEGEILVSKAKDKGVILAVGFIERFNPAFMALERLLVKERPLIVDFKRVSPFPERISEDSVVLDMMIHDIDLAFKIADSNVLEFKAEGRRERSKFLDYAFVNIFFENGLIANIEASRLSEKKERIIKLNCEERDIEVDLLNKKVFSLSLPDLNLPFSPPEKKRIPVLIADQLTLELKDFVNSIKKRVPPKVNGEDGLKALGFALEVEKRAKRCKAKIKQLTVATEKNL